MTTREILTIQLGHYANFVGTHWWNIQEANFSYDPENPSDIDPDILYREGEISKKVTFTPRLLLADLKGSLGYLSEEGNLAQALEENDNKEPEVLWEEGRLEKTEEPSAKKSPFVRSLEGDPDHGVIDLENQTEKWVDFLVPRLHPRTVNVITEYEHGSVSHPFDIYQYGQHLWKNKRFSENFMDNIRTYVEECDSLQGFQVLLDADNGFSGLGSSCIEYLRDEYGKSILSFPVIDAAYRHKSISDYVRLINTVLCWHSLGENASLFSPLTCDGLAWPVPNRSRKFDNITYRPDLHYHTSAILATALDTLSLRYRHKKYPMYVLSDLCADLNKHGRKAVATSISLPFPMVAKKDLIDVLDELDNCLWKTLTPACKITVDNNMQILALRGIPKNRLKRPVQDATREQVEKAAYRCSTVHGMMSFYLDCSCHRTFTYLTTTEQPLKIADPYPKIFNTNIQEDGNISESPRTGNVKSTPVMAGLHTGKFLADMYETLHTQIRRISLNKFHAFIDSGLEQDEFYESINNLMDCKENYEEHDV